MRVIVAEPALADLARLHAFLKMNNPAAAERSASVLAAAVQSLETFPERGRPSGLASARELVVPFGRSNYLLRYVYRQDADEVIVLRIWHGREDRD